jgi:hypothetical protein
MRKSEDSITAILSDGGCESVNWLWFLFSDGLGRDEPSSYITTKYVPRDSYLYE